MNSMSRTTSFSDDTARWEAVRRRDLAADDDFLYSVATTGVFCRPSCAARPALRVNVSFHANVAAALAAGFRPCKRCRPDLPPRAEREAILVARACRVIDNAETPPALATVAAEIGLSPHHFHRLFRRVTGVTPKAYADARRQSRVQDALLQGQPITAAFYDAGFNSSGRFYEAADGMLGMTPSSWQAGGKGEVIRFTHTTCGLGLVLVAVSTRGVCAILLGEDPQALAKQLQARFPRADLRSPDPDLGALVTQVVALIDHPTVSPRQSLPLDIRGTAFQRRVWEALRSIPSGHTVSYAQVAASIGQPRAVRAVAAACGANALAVVVPCHRVIGSDGRLTGYRWGVERKRELLRRETASSAA